MISYGFLMARPQILVFSYLKTHISKLPRDAITLTKVFLLSGALQGARYCKLSQNITPQLINSMLVLRGVMSDAVLYSLTAVAIGF